MVEARRLRLNRNRSIDFLLTFNGGGHVGAAQRGIAPIEIRDVETALTAAVVKYQDDDGALGAVLAQREHRGRAPAAPARRSPYGRAGGQLTPLDLARGRGFQCR